MCVKACEARFPRSLALGLRLRLPRRRLQLFENRRQDLILLLQRRRVGKRLLLAAANRPHRPGDGVLDRHQRAARNGHLADMHAKAKIAVTSAAESNRRINLRIQEPQSRVNLRIQEPQSLAFRL